jgi:hypothetical protein
VGRGSELISVDRESRERPISTQARQSEGTQIHWRRGWAALPRSTRQNLWEAILRPAAERDHLGHEGQLGADRLEPGRAEQGRQILAPIARIGFVELDRKQIEHPVIIRPILLSSTVFPVPRRPSSIIERALLPCTARPQEIVPASRMACRPASSGEGLPAAGANGLRYGSISSPWAAARLAIYREV